MRILFLILAVWVAWAAGAVAAERRVRYSDRLVRTITEQLASEAVEGRDNDTPGSELAQEKLVRRLRRIGRGLNPAGRKSEAFKQRFVANGQTGTNLLAVIRGTERPNEYVIAGAHYDHLDTRSDATGRCSASGTPGGAVCPGATDNAAGTATVLAIGRALHKHRPRRSIVLALWDAEEDGLLGSLHYVANPLVPLADTVAYVNFDILGSNLLPSLNDTSFAVAGETGTTLPALVAGAIAAEGFGTLPISYIFGQLRSDYASFVGRSIPTVFFSDSTNGCYHTVNDDLDAVDWAKLGTQGRIALRTVLAVANAATRPAFVPPNPALATYEDALTLQQVFTRAQVDLPRFSPADQVVLSGIRTTLDAIVADGPATFDGADVAALLTTALDGIAAIDRLGCLAP